jgi:pantothenate synthetase
MALSIKPVVCFAGVLQVLQVTVGRTKLFSFFVPIFAYFGNKPFRFLVCNIRIFLADMAI